jgi:hypothetical protein
MEPTLDEETRLSFQRALRALQAERAQFVLAGAFATNHYTGIWRDTKDIDVFCRPSWAGRILDILARNGFVAHVEEQHWLGKARRGAALVDVIWGSGNWSAPVDDHWFANATLGHIVGIEVAIAPVSDMILSKAWVAGRERYDGADICHLIHAAGHDLDWEDVVARFGVNWALLLQYLVLYRFVYPEERDVVPASLVRELASRIGTDAESADGLTFRGPLVDRYAYLHDLRHDGRPDPREEMARRGGWPTADVARRRELDSAAFDRGIPYRSAVDADAVLAEESAGTAQS